MSAQTGISQAPFGTLPDGRQVTQFTLANDNGMVVRILDFGGIITQIHVPDRHGVAVPDVGERQHHVRDDDGAVLGHDGALTGGESDGLRHDETTSY